MTFMVQIVRDYILSLFLTLQGPTLDQKRSLGEVEMHPAESIGDAEEPRGDQELAGNAPKPEKPQFP